MARIVSLTLYRIQTGFSYYGSLYNLPTRVVRTNVMSQDILRVDPINSTGNPSLAGLGYLYTKITFRQVGLNQEAYVMNSVAEITNLINTGN